MQVFIFGAGASQASQAFPTDSTAPLVNELFSANYEKYADLAGMSVARLREYRAETLVDTPLENWLTEKWNKIENYALETIKYSEKADFGSLTFYIWSLLRAVSANYNETNKYATLLRKLRQQMLSFGLINFNYDTLLDLALDEVFSADFLSIDDYYDNLFKITYLKPHGSINWLLQKRETDPEYTAQSPNNPYRDRDRHAGIRMFNGGVIRADSFIVLPVRVLEAEIRHKSEHSGVNYFYPFVLVPLTTKLYPQFSGFSTRIIDAGKTLIRDAREIYLVGYRAKDDIIREMFVGSSSDATLHVVGRKNAAEIMADVLGWAPLKEGRVYDDGFASFAENF